MGGNVIIVGSKAEWDTHKASSKPVGTAARRRGPHGGRARWQPTGSCLHGRSLGDSVVGATAPGTGEAPSQCSGRASRAQRSGLAHAHTPLWVSTTAGPRPCLACTAPLTPSLPPVLRLPLALRCAGDRGLHRHLVSGDPRAWAGPTAPGSVPLSPAAEPDFHSPSLGPGLTPRLRVRPSRRVTPTRPCACVRACLLGVDRWQVRAVQGHLPFL